MIPEFPNFKSLEITDKDDIERLTSEFLPYSDFNFASLFTWDTTGQARIATSNGNFVIRFQDYVTGESFYSFLGTNQIMQTVEELIEKSKKENLRPSLKLIPQVVIDSEAKLGERFEVDEDRDNFDYIFLINGMASMDGGDYAVKRNFVNRFNKLYDSEYKILDITSGKTKQEILDVIDAWARSRGKEQGETDIEFNAIQRVIQYGDRFGLFLLGLYIDGKMVGFSINDLGKGGYATNLFEKADINYEGIFPYLRHITCAVLQEKGYQFLNFEQDLGIKGLRKSKLSYIPKDFLKKYIISEKN